MKTIEGSHVATGKDVYHLREMFEFVFKNEFKI